MGVQIQISLGESFNDKALHFYPALHRAEQYVRSHLTSKVTLSQVASVAHLERKYFSAFFHAKVGVRFRDWLRWLRIERAQELMQACHQRIPHIAFGAGFRDVRSFERAFKVLTGMTPRAYRARVLPESRILTHQSRQQPR